VDKW